MIPALLLATTLLGTPALVCTGSTEVAQAKELRASVEAGALYALASTQLGPPTACSFSRSAASEVGLTLTFKDTSVLKTEAREPEMSSSVLVAARGLAEQAVLEALAPMAKTLGIALTAPTESRFDRATKTRTRVFRSHDEGVNARVELDQRGKRVTRVTVVIAL